MLIAHGHGGGYDQGLVAGRMFIGQGYRLIAPSRFGYLRTPYQRTAQRIPGAGLLTLEQGGHIPVDHLEEVVAEVQDFLTRTHTPAFLESSPTSTWASQRPRLGKMQP